MNDYGSDLTDVTEAPGDSGTKVDGPDAVDYINETADLNEARSDPDVPSSAQDTDPVDDLSKPTFNDVGDAQQALANDEDTADLRHVPDTSESEVERPQDWQENEAVDLGHYPEPDTPKADALTDRETADGTDLGAPEAVEQAETERAPVPDDGTDLGTLDTDIGKETDAKTEAESDSPNQGTVSDDAPPEGIAMEEPGPDIGAEGRGVGITPSIDELTDAARNEARSGDEQRASNDVDTAYAMADEAPLNTASPRNTGVSEHEEVPAPDAPWASGASETMDVPTGSANSPDNHALTSALTDRGISLEPVDRFDYSDNPVLGYRESAPPEDIAYAVITWNDQIAPGLASGATREDFAAYDQEHGLEGHQRLAGVYDYMLGDDAITSGGQREDGSLDVNGGRHRIEQARLHGIQYLPVRKR